MQQLTLAQRLVWFSRRFMDIKITFDVITFALELKRQMLSETI